MIQLKHMKILIIEDEPIIARRIKRMVSACLEQQLTQINICNSVESGLQFLGTQEIDLLFLDLNLSGEDGFTVLESMVAAPFHTIIISAYQEKAITAFEYGVLDFIPKPFNQERIAKALSRLKEARNTDESTRFLAIQKKRKFELIEIQEIQYIKGAGIYSELFLNNGKREIHNKNLDKLGQLLPSGFDRIHKSYIVNSTLIEEILVQAGGKYTLVLQNEINLPISRTRYKALKDKWAL